MLPGNVVSIASVKRAHDNFLAAHDRSFDFILNPIGLLQDAKSHISANSSLRMRSGNLLNKTNVRMMRTSNKVLVRYTNTAKYAFAQDSGSGTHGPSHTTYPITPKREGYPLRFFWARMGRWHASYLINHPGVPATHFLENARNVAFRTKVALLRSAMQRNARRF